MSIAVIFGGKSCEHNVSIVTGVQVLNEAAALNPVPVYIDPDGEWRTGRELFAIEGCKNPKRLRKVYMRPSSDVLFGALGRKICRIDAAVLCCHGAHGEDGTLQGFLELCGVPYTGCDVLSSSLCMDKAAFKTFTADKGIPSVPYTCFTRAEFNRDIYSLSLIHI